jgi:hypothetical protein
LTFAHTKPSASELSEPIAATDPLQDEMAVSEIVEIPPPLSNNTKPPFPSLLLQLLPQHDKIDVKGQSM